MVFLSIGLCLDMLRRVSARAGIAAAVALTLFEVVAVYREGNHLGLALHRIWAPIGSEPLDLEATSEDCLRDLHARYWLRAIYCDPYQLYRSSTTLKAAGLRIEEFPQTGSNLTRMGQGLFDLLNGRTLRIFPAHDLRAHALTPWRSNPRAGGSGWRRSGPRRKSSHRRARDGLRELPRPAPACSGFRELIRCCRPARRRGDPGRPRKAPRDDRPPHRDCLRHPSR